MAHIDFATIDHILFVVLLICCVLGITGAVIEMRQGDDD